MGKKFFDETLAKECAFAFAGATGLGCIVSDKSGELLAEYGYGCASCQICALTQQPQSQCTHVQSYSMTLAERFGGKYIYSCPMGLTCFVSPILDEVDVCGHITAGPFLMVEREDYIDYELNVLNPQFLQAAIDELQHIPVVSTTHINQLSTLLFLAVGFINKVSASNRLLEIQSSDAIQGQISSYILHLKQESLPPPYPFAEEKAFLKSIRQSNKAETQRLLNELLGHILFASGQKIPQVKSRVCELLVLTGRAAIDAGADADTTLRLCHESRQAIEASDNIEKMCLSLTETVHILMDNLFQFSDIRHAQAIHLCMQYMDNHYYDKITLEKLAEMVYLSPSYLSRIFKKETGYTINEYLIQVRIEKAKRLLHRKDLRVTDVADAVGFDDQSYFTKVFRRMVGTTPLKYKMKIN